MPQDPVIVWFRQDLRIADNPALHAAGASGRPMVPVYVLDDETPGAWRLGGASRWWLHGSLAELQRALAQRGVPLVLRRGIAAEAIVDLAREVGAGAVHWNRHVEPFWRDAERDLDARLRAAGVAARSFPGSYLFEPGPLAGRSGAGPRVFTPFWKACLAAGAPAAPLPAPDRLAAVDPAPASEALESWGLLPTKPEWAEGLRETWAPGERFALDRLREFVADGLAAYGRDRNRLEPDATSRLSPRLHFGEISPRQVWRAARHRIDAEPAAADGGWAFLRQLAWREFYAHVLADAPTLPEKPLQPRFADFPWMNDGEALARWQRGQTGYPIVDAAMRQLWRIGWMHNRARLITASFLIKDLLVPWQRGQAWFWDTLVCADLANNAGSWQWVAGSDTDAAPFFRVFNPVVQGEKFDPTGAYIRRWVPELARLSERWIHRPWEAPPLDLAAAKVRLGETYPEPMVDHAGARARALAAFERIKGRV